ncbi:hypothetical protein [Litoreibacter halocynthiae]|uniref:hypothetical protein n=1 Tax=Litoreibacter halocynthiae TaxID=1242689 RepID=UPI002490083E|nr:hypothetical protein [Litoreibacter halocynthiae]
MSDPVTIVDVEDVLSSIRRLVSDTKNEDRQDTKAPEASSEGLAETAEEQPKATDALILTSALRVKSTEQDSVPEFSHATMSNFRHTLSEESAVEAEDDASAASTDQGKWSLADDDYYEDDMQPEAAPVIDFIRHGKGTKSEPATGELSDAEETWEPEFVDGTPEGEDAEQADPVEDWVDDEPEAAEMPADEDDEAEAQADEISEITEADDEAVDHDDGGHDENADDGHNVEDADEETVFADEVEFVSAAAASVVDGNMDNNETNEDVDLADFDESVVDEDALRDLVADIVRQELTGELGERITRNVRKLVRREIHRAVMTREFE